MFADFEQDNNNEDFLDDFRQKLNSPSSETFEERKNEINRSKNVFVGTISGIALAAVVGWFVLSPRYATQSDTEIPVIRRPQTAVKVQPSDPGGMEIQNQDKSVYDIIEKKQENAPVVENLLPPPEVPQLPTITAETQVSSNIGNPEIIQKAENIIKSAEDKAPVTNASTAPIEENVKIAQPTQVAVVQNEPEPKKEITIKEASLAQPEKTEAEKINIPAKAETPTPQQPVAVATTGDWQVQLISSPNRSSVDAAWNGLVKKYPSLKGQPREIETADLGSKGTYYRLKAGAFAERSGADKLCNDIKALGGTCIVKKK